MGWFCRSISRVDPKIRFTNQNRVRSNRNKATSFVENSTPMQERADIFRFYYFSRLKCTPNRYQGRSKPQNLDLHTDNISHSGPPHLITSFARYLNDQNNSHPI